MLRKNFVFLLLIIVLGCSEDEKREKEIAKIPVKVELERFDLRFANATPDSLQSLKADFPYLFPKQYHDSVWIQKMEDTIQFELNESVRTQFPDMEETQEDLERLYQHIAYYFPNAYLPRVVTLTSDVDYRNKVVWTDEILLISLDTYLGPENPLYMGVQDFIRKNFRRDLILSDVAGAFAESKTKKPVSRSFLNNMVYFGKVLYLKDLLIPFDSDAQKMGYSEEEIKWAEANEDQIWRYFVEKELLYSTDTQLGPRFLFPAPFSKFYLELDNEAPDRLGQYMGWQIVRQFMKRNEVSLQELLNTDAETIFKKSNYKPSK